MSELRVHIQIGDMVLYENGEFQVVGLDEENKKIIIQKVGATSPSPLAVSTELLQRR